MNETPTTSLHATQLAKLAGRKVDVLVIGGGIVGAGVGATPQCGLNTALVEQGDFASGTSSRSSRLLHGGLRYPRKAA